MIGSSVLSCRVLFYSLYYIQSCTGSTDTKCNTAQHVLSELCPARLTPVLSQYARYSAIVTTSTARSIVCHTCRSVCREARRPASTVHTRPKTDTARSDISSERRSQNLTLNYCALMDKLNKLYFNFSSLCMKQMTCKCVLMYHEVCQTLSMPTSAAVLSPDPDSRLK